MAQWWNVVSALVVMVGLAFMAFGLPRFIYQDVLPEVGQRSWVDGSDVRGAICTVTTARQERLVYSVPCAQIQREAIERLKRQGTVGYKIPPVLTQVTAARMIGETPEDVEGTVVWRTLFGISVGESWVNQHHSSHNLSLNINKHLGILLAFLLAEGALAGFLLSHLWRLWSDWFWPLSRP